MPSSNDEHSLSRRRALVGAAGLGVLSVAGCVGAEDSSSPDNSTNGGSVDLERPVPPASPDDEYWQFVVESLDYQNRILEEM